jgi:hypothetical protein
VRFAPTWMSKRRRMASNCEKVLDNKSIAGKHAGLRALQSNRVRRKTVEPHRRVTHLTVPWDRYTRSVGILIVVLESAGAIPRMRDAARHRRVLDRSARQAIRTHRRERTPARGAASSSHCSSHAWPSRFRSYSVLPFPVSLEIMVAPVRVRLRVWSLSDVVFACFRGRPQVGDRRSGAGLVAELARRQRQSG